MSKRTVHSLARCGAFAATVAVSALVAAPASADRYASAGYRPSYVVAESHWGNGTISGPVRHAGRRGWQVRLPRGTWIDCGRSCTETLRRATVDFWEAQGGNQSKDSGPGYFRWEFRY